MNLYTFVNQFLLTNMIICIYKYMILDPYNVSTLLKDLRVDVGVLRSRQINLLNRIRKSVELNKLKKIKSNLNK